MNADGKAVAYARWVIRWRVPVLVGTVLVVVGAGSGLKRLGVSDDMRVFFQQDDPQLLATEAVEHIYTKNTNILFVVVPEDGNVFTPTTLAAVEELTREAWKIPFAIRVDAVTNFQHTRADGDDLIVEDLVSDAASRSARELAEARRIALERPELVNRLLSPAADVTGVNVTVQLPEEAPDEVSRAGSAARALADSVETAHPNLRIYLTGAVMMDHTFAEVTMRDMQTLVPLMYLGIVLAIGLLLRSAAGALVTVLVIGASLATAMGLAGWAGILISAPSANAPTMILTLAVADSIHILVTMIAAMRRGVAKHDALVESLRVNLQPVFLTSLTTAIGFLSMNFSSSPPLRDLGNLTAVGVVGAFVYSVLLLPALAAVLPLRIRPVRSATPSHMERLANLVIVRRRPLLWVSSAVVLGLGALAVRNDLDEDFVEYFARSVPFRVATDFTAEHLTGLHQIEFSVDAGESGGISEPMYLATLDRFAEWYRRQPGVMHVSSLSETMKRLNQSMHGDDPVWYRLPESRELAAQYLLLYELSLPYGLDLNDQVNVDKSATRVTVTGAGLTARDIRELAARGQEWLERNAPPAMVATGAGDTVMFAHLAQQIVHGMLRGTVLAFVLVSVVLIVALRSARFGLLSLIPNVVPAVAAFGVWALAVGRVNIGLAVVAAMTFGIVVDDTVHFLSKYLRARREMQLGAEDGIRYAFASVGKAIAVTSAVLVAGFAVLSLSAFDVNAGMGKLSAVTIAFALLADFLLLPPLLIKLGERERDTWPAHAVGERGESDEGILPAHV
ncbi:MAG: MMPL family transporter [Gemmatimonadales bacterium]|nr:MMPL family transporter [Gemmatimonadales bacterium]NIN12007.1 MMPL family transporter [Gemmatimonadales bacterium]NIN50538.1 MMPL family transporter [Gemmatimonadales bacterium]NIP08002.1 MMPL family transporter [Gemmatimonadales bacterium]NIR00604.1 MMPL family transporter [Gemmatimonadales bacterium]